MTSELHASDFAFDLPPERIAQHPAQPRDAARLLQVAAVGARDLVVRDLPTLLRRGDIMVANDTRVIPAQLEGWRGKARIGITLDRPLADGAWHALARNARRLRCGDTLVFDDAFTATVRSRDDDGGVVLAFDSSGGTFDEALRRCGALALPPYIARAKGPTAADQRDYQTVFALQSGAVAAPTAGLHFTPELLDALSDAGILQTTATLHVGAGTFLPLRHNNVRDHHIHAEYGAVSPATAAAVNAARAAGGRVIAVGTTTLRLLETATSDDGVLHPWSGETDLFILPGYRFRSVDLLLTNFHLPRSTLFMLACAFAGADRMRAAYAHAIASGYRFYSYGDATLLERA